MSEHMTPSAGKDALAKVRELHRPVQWRGWRRWVAALAQDRRAFVDQWCRECGKAWPCPTATRVIPPGVGDTGDTERAGDGE